MIIVENNLRFKRPKCKMRLYLNNLANINKYMYSLFKHR